jgi:cell division protein DivIC
MAKHKTKRKIAFKKRRQNRLGMMLVSAVVLMMCLVMVVSMASLRKKRDGYIEREQSLQQQIEAENRRAEELKEYEKYTKTAAYVEEVAKDKLGLVYEDEVVFQAEEK